MRSINRSSKLSMHELKLKFHMTLPTSPVGGAERCALNSKDIVIQKIYAIALQLFFL